LLEEFSLPEDWASRLFQMTAEEERELAQSSAILVQESRNEPQNINGKLPRLLDGYLD